MTNRGGIFVNQEIRNLGVNTLVCCTNHNTHPIARNAEKITQGNGGNNEKLAEFAKSRERYV